MDVERSHQIKIKLLSTMMFIFFSLIIVFLFKWQILDYSKYKVLANQRISNEKIPSIRGAILARDGSTLAYSEPRFDIYAYKPEIISAEEKGKQTREEFTKKVGIILGDESKLKGVLESGPDWIKIADSVQIDTKNQIFDIKLDKYPKQNIYGLFYELGSKRIYPEGQLAAHVIGFLGKNSNNEDVGRGGLEQYRDGVLSPQEGFDFSERDSLGNIITISDNNPIEAKRGSTLYTTIDKTLQQKIEEKLKEGVEKYNARGGTTIVMDPKTGEILAMANYPTYDPNKYYEVKDGLVFRNQAISTPYEIGSVMKIVTMSSAIDTGKIQPNTIVVNGHKGCEHLLEEKEVCTYDKKPQGPLMALQALIRSDNIALYHTAQLIGADTFYNYLKKFGVGAISGIDLAGESYNALPESKYWNLADLATFSYGHSYQVTPIQAITAFGSLANNGEMLQPYIVSRIEDSNGNVKEFKPVVVSRTVDTKTADSMTDMLNEVYKFDIKDKVSQRKFKDYRVAMKSGTALIPCALVPEAKCSGYSSEYNATFVGYDASPDRTFIMLVKLERPKLISATTDLSYFNARLLWLDTFDTIKDYIGVEKFTN